MKLRYVNLLWLTALLLSWAGIFVAWSFYRDVANVKIHRLEAQVKELEKEIDDLKKPS